MYGFFTLLGKIGPPAFWMTCTPENFGKFSMEMCYVRFHLWYGAFSFSSVVFALAMSPQREVFAVLMKRLDASKYNPVMRPRKNYLTVLEVVGVLRVNSIRSLVWGWCFKQAFQR